MNKDLTVKEMGRRGGAATLKKYGKEHFIEISKKGKKSREQNKKRNEKLSISTNKESEIVSDSGSQG
jgi:general stress protein YciG